ncbi:MAG: HYExAFE family protein [Tepidisphaeraceae bacterium]
MADRTIHYEAAFEACLRDKAVPYVAVDEAKKALFHSSSLKSFDFVVYSKQGPNLLVDVKGRECRTNSRKRSLQTWATQEDVDDLTQWEQVFGEGFKGMLCFVYHIDPPIAPEPGMFLHGQDWYWMFGVDLAEYRNRMRKRSEKWKTVALPMGDFRQLARPIESWL